MAKKKQEKHKPLGGVNVGGLATLAEEQLAQGQIDEAIKWLLRAEAETKRLSSRSGKGASLPPHLAAAQASIAPFLARAFGQRALAAKNFNQQIADLEEALKRAPADTTCLLALGACQLLLGRPEQAYERFRQAHKASPEDLLVNRAFALGLLATGQTREAVDWLRRASEGHDQIQFQRLNAIRDLLVGNFARTRVRLGDDEGGKMKDEIAGQKRVPSCILNPASLLSGLPHLAAGEIEWAQKQLTALPSADHNPSRAEAAVLATQFFYSGALCFQTQRFKEAAAHWFEARRLAQAHAFRLPWLEGLAVYYHHLAESAIRHGEQDLAIECWQRTLELEPGNKMAAANLSIARRVQANQAWRAGDTERAVKLWQESLTSSPQDERLLKNLAIGCEQLERKQEAVTHWRLLARLWRQQAKTRAAEPQFKQRLLRLEQHLVKLMIAAELSGNEVFNELESAPKLDPDNHDLRRQCAELLLEIGRPQQALKYLEIIERQQGQSADLLVQKGMTFDQMRRPEQARKAFERALELDPSHAIARRSYLVLLGNEARQAQSRGQLERASEICRQQLSIDSRYAPALANLASLSFSLGRKKEGLEWIARYLETEPSSPQKRVTAGSIYLAHGYNREAEAEFKRAIELEPSEICYFNIGLCYLEHDKLKKALQYFDLAIEAGSFDVLLEIFSALAEADYLREAERYLDLAISRYPQHPLPHFAKAIHIISSNPLAFLLTPEMLEKAWQEIVEAERLSLMDNEFKDMLDDVRKLKRDIERMRHLERQLDFSAEEEAEEDWGPIPPEVWRRLYR